MARLTRAAQRFIQDYTIQYPTAREAAELAKQKVEAVVRGLGIVAPLISSRAKTPESLRDKLRRKRYRRPHLDVTDTIGVRVITYYRDDVDRVASRLIEEFDVHGSKTTDKRRALGLRDFGYRSVHLIVRLRQGRDLAVAHTLLRDRWFEIQVRSILEHAWAEIEHEIVYKAGTVFEEDVVRRFAALAGTLEVLDHEFLSLRDERNRLIDRYAERYAKRQEMRKPFDVARLVAFLEVMRPTGRGWRQAAREGSPFAVGLDKSCVEAIRIAGLGTPASLLRTMRSPRFRYSIRTFAASQGIDPARTSHLAAIVLAIATKDRRIISRHFPEIMADPALASIFHGRAR